jgi:hypothetical protein
MRRTYPTERYVRQLPLITDARALAEADSQDQQALLEQIVANPLDEQAGGRRPRTRRRTVVLIATVGLLSLAAVGWAVMSLLGSTTVVACHTRGDPSSGIGIDLVTGDPVADCAAIWEQDTGQSPPELTAYENATGGIAVLPTDAEVPAGWRPLAAGTAQDPRVIELRVALDDQIAGLPSSCMDAQAGEQLAEGELERLGLSGWSVATERGEADGTDSCTFFRLDPNQARVILYPREGSVAPDDSPPAVYARELGRAVSDGCLTLDSAAELAEEIASETGIEEEGLVINESTDADAGCTRVHVTVAGRIEVHLRGPMATG